MREVAVPKHAVLFIRLLVQRAGALCSSEADYRRCGLLRLVMLMPGLCWSRDNTVQLLA